MVKAGTKLVRKRKAGDDDGKVGGENSEAGSVAGEADGAAGDVGGDAGYTVAARSIEEPQGAVCDLGRGGGHGPHVAVGKVATL